MSISCLCVDNAGHRRKATVYAMRAFPIIRSTKSSSTFFTVGLFVSDAVVLTFLCDRAIYSLDLVVCLGMGIAKYLVHFASTPYGMSV